MTTSRSKQPHCILDTLASALSIPPTPHHPTYTPGGHVQRNIAFMTSLTTPLRRALRLATMRQPDRCVRVAVGMPTQYTQWEGGFLPINTRHAWHASSWLTFSPCCMALLCKAMVPAVARPCGAARRDLTHSSGECLFSAPHPRVPRNRHRSTFVRGANPRSKKQTGLTEQSHTSLEGRRQPLNTAESARRETC